MTNKLPKIYIPNAGGHDFSKAEVFGELVKLSEGLFPLSSLGAMIRLFTPIVKNSSPNDYILICGPTTMNLILGGLFILKHHRLNLLIWTIDKNRDGDYRKRNLVFNLEDLQ